MRKLLAHLMFLGGTLNCGFAQPVISGSDLLGMIGRTQLLETDRRMSFGVNVGMSGPNRTWDYSASSIPNPVRINTTFLAAAGTPFESDFPGANFVQRIVDSANAYTLFNYFQVAAGGLTELGSGSIIGPPIDTMFVEYKNNAVSPLPLMYGSMWMTALSDTTGLFPSFANISIDTTRYRVDAWGTVILPSGTYQCLRVREDFKHINLTIIGGSIFSSSTETGIQYNWISRNDYSVLNIQSLDGATDSNFTMARGLTWIESQSTHVTPIDAGIPETHALRQNYPNPFNPSTVIEFSLPRTGEVQLEVFDILGRHVATLADGVLDAGTYRITFSPPGTLASGAYIYRLRTSAGTLARSMLLQK